jgi:hypothetical protein
MPLSRDKPFSSFSKPGSRIEMSMIFKDESKIDVICPKCDTISSEKKGPFIEW